MKTIQLTGTWGALNILVYGDKVRIPGLTGDYTLNKTEATRLLMFCTDLIRRSDAVVMDFCEECGKRFPSAQLSADRLRCVKCDHLGITNEGESSHAPI